MKEETLLYEASCFDGEGIWMSPTIGNGLYYHKIGENKAEWKGSFDEEGEFRLHGDAVCVDGVLYFAPERADCFDFYDIKHETFGQISLIKEKEHFLYAMHIVQYKNHLYWADRFSDFIVYEYDIAQKEIHTYYTHNVFEKAVLKYAGTGMDMLLMGHCLYFVSTTSNCIIEFDIERHSFHDIEIESCNNGFNTICYDGKYFWLSGRMGITRYHIDKKESKDYTIYPDGFGMVYMDADKRIQERQGFDDTLKEFPFSVSVANDRGVYFFPYRVNMIVYIEEGKEKLEGIKLQPETEQSLTNCYRPTPQKFIGIKKITGTRIMASSTLSFSECVLDCEKGIVENGMKIVREIPLWNLRSKKVPVLYEYEKGRLDDFLKCIVMYKTDYTKASENIGKRIDTEILKIV